MGEATGSRNTVISDKIYMNFELHGAAQRHMNRLLLPCLSIHQVNSHLLSTS